MPPPFSPPALSHPPGLGAQGMEKVRVGLGTGGKQEMATHSSILAWRIPRVEESGGLQSVGCKELDRTE